MEEKLRQALTDLREQLLNASAEEASKQALLDRVLADIDEMLDMQVETTRERHDSLLAGLAEAAENFEASHPKLTNFIDGVTNMLSGLGI